MRPKLKENPREWLKFTLSFSVALAIVATLLWQRGTLGMPAFLAVVAVLVVADLFCLARPAWFRGVYRAGMTVSFYLGQVVGRVLLSVFFFCLLTPLGLLLRLMGKDLLKLKKPPSDSYWQPAKPAGELDRQF
jgi:ABC-type xylose transport system permease subunit